MPLQKTVIARLLAMSLLLSGPALAAPDLAQVYALALNHDPEIAAAEAAWRASQELLPQARAALLPQLSASASVKPTQQHAQTASTDTRTYYTSRVASLTLSQVIYDQHAFLALDQADARVAGAAFEWQVARQDLILRVAQAYLDLLFAQDAVGLAEAKMQAIQAQQRQAEHMYQGGMGTVTDIQEAQARYDLARAEAIDAQNTLRIKRQALFKLTQRWLDEVSPLSATLPMPEPAPNDLAAWRKAALEGALEVLKAEKALESARYDVDMARSQHLPVLTMVGANTVQKTPDNVYQDNNNASIGLQLNMPLLAGGRTLSVTREALARVDQATQALALAGAESAMNATEAFYGVNNSIARSRALEQAVRSSEVALDAARIGLDVGYRTSVDVLNAQQQWFSARKDLLQQRYNFIIARLKLKAAVGGLTDDDIQSIQAWFAS